MPMPTTLRIIPNKIFCSNHNPDHRAIISVYKPQQFGHKYWRIQCLCGEDWIWPDPLVK